MKGMSTLMMLESALNKEDTMTETQLRYEANQRDHFRRQERMVLASSAQSSHPKLENPIFNLQD